MNLRDFAAPRMTCIVCERDGSWAAVLRRLIAAEAIRIRECRSRAEVIAELSGADASTTCIAWELRPGNLDEVCRGLTECETRWPRPYSLVLGEWPFLNMQWDLRELGAIHFVPSRRRLDLLRDILVRLASRLPRWEDGFPKLAGIPAQWFES